jgi:hypothetical protein
MQWSKFVKHRGNHLSSCTDLFAKFQKLCTSMSVLTLLDLKVWVCPPLILLGSLKVYETPKS